MDWQKEIQKACERLNISAQVEGEKKILFICAKIPEKDQKEKLISVLPTEFTYEFIESPKITTLTTLIGLCMNLSISPRVPEVKDRHLKFSAFSNNPQIDEDHEIWDIINKTLISDGFFESWEIEINKIRKSFNLKIAQEHKKITRDYGITEDEILNLKIALNQDITFDQFLELI